MHILLVYKAFLFLFRFFPPTSSPFICSPPAIHLYLESRKRRGSSGCASAVLHCPSRDLGNEAGSALSLYAPLLRLIGAKASAGIQPAWRLRCGLQELTEHGMITWLRFCLWGKRGRKRQSEPRDIIQLSCSDPQMGWGTRFSVWAGGVGNQGWILKFNCDWRIFMKKCPMAEKIKRPF